MNKITKTIIAAASVALFALAGPAYAATVEGTIAAFITTVGWIPQVAKIAQP